MVHRSVSTTALARVYFIRARILSAFGPVNFLSLYLACCVFIS